MNPDYVEYFLFINENNDYSNNVDYQRNSSSKNTGAVKQ